MSVAEAPDLDSFPEAEVVPFPVGSVSPAITSIATVLVAGAVPSLVVGADRLVKFMTEEARRLLGVTGEDPVNVADVESRTGLRIGDLSESATASIHLQDRGLTFTLVPLSGASGAVLIFRESENRSENQTSFVSFLQETILSPLRSVREMVYEVTSVVDPDPRWIECASTIEQILSSLEMAPQVREPAPALDTAPVIEVLQSVATRFRLFADLKGISVQVDAPGVDEPFAQHAQLNDALSVLVDNSIHYLPGGGQIVIGARRMEHKGLPLLLFFVMDNGPVVPEALRAQLFDAAFAWDPLSSERSGRALFRVRDFAVANGGSVWVESRSGKACTFFLRVRPNARSHA